MKGNHEKKIEVSQSNTFNEFYKIKIHSPTYSQETLFEFDKRKDNFEINNFSKTDNIFRNKNKKKKVVK